MKLPLYTRRFNKLNSFKVRELSVAYGVIIAFESGHKQPSDGFIDAFHKARESASRSTKKMIVGAILSTVGTDHNYKQVLRILKDEAQK